MIEYNGWSSGVSKQKTEESPCTGVTYRCNKGGRRGETRSIEEFVMAKMGR